MVDPSMPFTQRTASIPEEVIRSQELQILKFFQKIRVRYMEEEEIRKIDPDLKSFFNINRPEESGAHQLKCLMI